jgi:hypothetical protein
VSKVSKKQNNNVFCDAKINNSPFSVAKRMEEKKESRNNNRKWIGMSQESFKKGIKT